MFINATGFYVPEERVDNQHFLELNGLTSEWIEQRTGIRSRSKAKAEGKYQYDEYGSCSQRPT